MNTALYPRKELIQVNSQKGWLGGIFYLIILNTGSALLKEKIIIMLTPLRHYPMAHRNASLLWDGISQKTWIRGYRSEFKKQQPESIYPCFSL